MRTVQYSFCYNICFLIISNLHHKWDLHLDLQMYQDLFKRLLSSSDEYVKKIGLMFGGRIIKTIKQKN